MFCPTKSKVDLCFTETQSLLRRKSKQMIIFIKIKSLILITAMKKPDELLWENGTYLINWKGLLEEATTVLKFEGWGRNGQSRKIYSIDYCIACYGGSAQYM